MKKIINFIIIMVLICPVIINALTKSDYDTSKEFANRYIFKYDDYKNYIVNSEELTQIPFVMNNEGLFYDDNFSVGGLLNIKEFEISKNSDGDTYLFDGASYWTMTSGNTGGKYAITTTADLYKESELNNSFGSRITEFVMHDVEVSGTGSYYNPWVFVPKRIITFDPNGGTVSTPTKAVIANNLYGPLPEPVYECNKFDGWYTKKTGGEKIEASTIVTTDTDQTLYAHWTHTPNAGELTYTRTSCNNCKSYGTYKYACGGSYNGYNVEDDASCVNSGALSYEHKSCDGCKSYGTYTYACGGTYDDYNSSYNTSKCGNNGTLSYTHQSCSSCKSYGTYKYACGGSYKGYNSSYDSSCKKSGSVSYSGTCGYVTATYSCGGTETVYRGSCTPSISCNFIASPSTFKYNKSVQLDVWDAEAYTNTPGYYSIVTTGFKNGKSCSGSAYLSSGWSNIRSQTLCSGLIIDVTSSKTGSKCMTIRVTHEDTNASGSCSWCYSWS